jgi:integrase
VDEATVEAIAAAVAERIGAKRAPHRDPFVHELVDRYEAGAEFKALRAWKTERARHKHLRRHLGDLRVSQLNEAVLDDYRLNRSTEPGARKVDGQRVLTSPSTRNREVDRLCRVVNWGVERGHVSVNPIAKHADEVEPPPPKTWVKPDDVDLLRAAALTYGKDPRIGLTLRAMISTKFDAFLRRSELCSLRWAQVDFRSGTIMLDLAETKAHREGVRITILSDRAAADIRAQQRWAGSPWTFTNTRGGKYNPRTFLRMAKAVAERAGLHAADGESWYVHHIRAGGITQQLELLTPQRDVMDMAGWTTDQTARYHRGRGAPAVARAKERLERARGNR